MLLFEINHPAHIHLFRNLSQELLQRGIASLFMIKSDPVIERLAEHYDLPTIAMGKKGKGLFQKYLFQFRFLWKSIKIVRKTGATMGLGVSMNLPLVSKFTRIISIGFDDDDMSATPIFAKFANKADVIITPDVLSHENRGRHHITYPGYHELAYLHPNRFTPDPTVMEMLGITKNEKYFIVRFNAFNAHHDVGESGMSFEQKKLLIKKLQQKGKVFISSEGKIDPEFNDLLLPNYPELMHSILSFASLYIGESQTITSEAAVLGIPSLRINSFAGRISYLEEQEKKYGLTYGFKPNQFDELFAINNLKQEWQNRRLKMLEDKMDVTSFFTWFVMEYPKSVEVVKQQRHRLFRQWL